MDHAVEQVDAFDEILIRGVTDPECRSWMTDFDVAKSLSKKISGEEKP